jgi:Tfp pilus assembly protein PilF
MKMYLCKRAASLAIAGTLNWTVPLIAFGQQPQVTEPNASDTSEFFGTDRAQPKDRRRLAENGCKYGWYAISRGLFNGAEETFQKAIEIDPTFAGGYFGMARIKWINKDQKDYLHYFDAAVKRDPTLASLYNKQKLENANVPKSPHTPQSEALNATKMGWQAFKEKDYTRALTFFDFAIKQDPGYAPGYFGTAYVYSVQHKLEKAVEYYRETIKREGTFPPAHANLAFALLLLNNEAEAKKELEEALKLDPKQGDAVMNFACYYGEHDKWDLAKQYAADAVQRGGKANAEAAGEFKKHGIELPF